MLAKQAKMNLINVLIKLKIESAYMQMLNIALSVDQGNFEKMYMNDPILRVEDWDDYL